mgnify:CR=1 FL=1
MSNKTPAQVALGELYMFALAGGSFAQSENTRELKETISKALEDQVEKDRVFELMAEALDKLARLGNAPMMGNSNANVVAQEALAEYQKLFGGE